jgi:putative ABC transport system permease protein
MRTLSQDLKFGIRVLRKSPGFTAATVAVLALGIGANTAIFTVVNAVLLRPLPFPDSGKLMQVWHVPPQQSFPGVTRFAVSAANYLDWQSQNHVFERMAIYTFGRLNLTGKGQPEPVESAEVSSDFFSVFQVQPQLGRGFGPDEDQPGHNNVVILSYPFWQSHFGADPGIVGQKITLDGRPHTVVGVMDASFRRPGFAKIWTPLAMTDNERAVRGEHHYLVVARLKPNIDQQQAQVEMDTISRRLEQQYPEDDKGWGAKLVPVREEMIGDVRPALLALIASVAFVLLIACANVANLVLSKTVARQKEIAIRTALGATRGRVLRQILSETVLLSLAGGALGLYLAHFGVWLIVHFFGNDLPKGIQIQVDGWVLAFTLAASVLAGILAGLAPAWRSSKTNLNDALKQGLSRTDSESGGNRTRNVLLVVEVALSLMLLIGAGLMMRSLWVLQGRNPGFDPRNVVTMNLVIPEKKFDVPLRESAFFDELLRRVRALPGVESAGVIDDLPITGGSNQPIAIEDAPVRPMSEQPEVAVRVISSDYIRAMRIPLLQGRDLSDADTADRPAAVLISESLARRYWPGENPVGKRLTLSFLPDRKREIVGVVGDVKQLGLDVDEPVATLYYSVDQLSLPAPGYGSWRSFPMVLVVRTYSQPSSIVSAVTATLQQIDKEVPVQDVITMDAFLGQSLSQRRFNMLLLSVFAGLALALAAVGIYSVLAYAVRRRTREIGIRVALGAQIGDVVRMVLADGLRPTLIGVAIGLTGALLLGRLVAHLMYGVSASDPATLVAVTLLLSLVAMLACAVPAYRASKVEPMKALRDE